MRTLFFRVYLHFVAIIVVFGVVVAIGWMIHDWDRDREYDRDDVGISGRNAGETPEREIAEGRHRQPPVGMDRPRHRRDHRKPPHRHWSEALAHLVVHALPEDEAGAGAALERFAHDFRVRLALYRADHTLIASARAPIPPPPRPWRTRSGWQRGEGRPVFLLRLPDDRWLSIYVPRRPRRPWLGLLVTLAVVIAIGAWPLARRITRRLERLQARVDALGAGDLGARVEVEGSDEVADLARSFNRAAQRIESLVAVQRTMLASASHELRSPLARMRMALELFATDPRPELRERIERDIAELDKLIDELLLASRLQMGRDLEPSGPVDLLALVAEEGARVEATVTGDPIGVAGDIRLLRHLVRNLFENARQHGGETDIDASVTSDADADGIRLQVCDRGPGIPASERESIFEPFYRPAAMRERGSGVGLGLHLVKVIAERHGAEVGCYPNEPTGSCFVIRFPSDPEPRGHRDRRPP